MNNNYNSATDEWHHIFLRLDDFSLENYEEWLDQNTSRDKWIYRRDWGKQVFGIYICDGEIALMFRLRFGL